MVGRLRGTGFWAAVVGVVALLGGCATIVNGKNQTLQFESRPAGATVFVDGHKLGRTPIATELRRNRSYKVRIELKGYESFKIRLQNELSGWYGMNLVWGAFFWIGMIVDGAVGSMYELQPRERSQCGRMLLHEGGRMYVRVRLRPRNGCHPPNVAGVDNPRHRCRDCVSRKPLRWSQWWVAKGGGSP